MSFLLFSSLCTFLPPHPPYQVIFDSSGDKTGRERESQGRQGLAGLAVIVLSLTDDLQCNPETLLGDIPFEDGSRSVLSLGLLARGDPGHPSLCLVGRYVVRLSAAWPLPLSFSSSAKP